MCFICSSEYILVQYILFKNTNVGPLYRKAAHDRALYPTTSYRLSVVTFALGRTELQWSRNAPERRSVSFLGER